MTAGPTFKSAAAREMAAEALLECIKRWCPLPWRIEVQGGTYTILDARKRKVAVVPGLSDGLIDRVTTDRLSGITTEQLDLLIGSLVLRSEVFNASATVEGFSWELTLSSSPSPGRTHCLSARFGLNVIADRIPEAVGRLIYERARELYAQMLEELIATDSPV